jgi:chorismate lyase / 3-hydroxybenzoate synthase
MHYGCSMASVEVVGAAQVQVQLPLPHLAGKAVETFDCGELVELQHMPGSLLTAKTTCGLLGVVTEPVTTETLEADTERAFRRFLKAAAGLHLYRVWNYVPAINHWEGELENYHRFNLGRARAYAEFPSLRIPAASAVGCGGQQLVSIFLAGTAEPQHLENPWQVPAWKYPALYGPQPPSFSRGTVVSGAAFLSGTASIRGHETLAVGDVAEQCRITLENMQQVLGEMGCGSLWAGTERNWWGKVYVRHVADVPAIEAALRKLGAGLLWERSTVVQADICRASLDVEIEVTVLP